jgi:hypothetical protein
VNCLFVAAIRRFPGERNFMKTKPIAVESMNAQKNFMDLGREALALAQEIMECAGELSPELEAKLNFNETALRSKVDAYVHVEEAFEAQEALWKRRAEACKAIANRFATYNERHKDRVKFVMQAMKVNEISGVFNRYKLSNSAPKLVITNESELPAQFKMVVTTTVADKEKIKAVLKDGFEIPGAHLEQGVTLRTYEGSEE